MPHRQPPEGPGNRRFAGLAPPRLRAAAVAALALLALLLAACAAPAPLVVLSPAAAGAKARAPVAPRPREADILHYDLDVEVDVVAGHVSGRASIRFAAFPDRPVTALLLDAVELTVFSVRDATGQPLAFRHDGDLLTVMLAAELPPGQTSSVHLQWECFPRRGLYFVGPSAASPAMPRHVWSQGQTHEARHWFPCRDLPDERATSTLRITCDEGFTTMAAGDLVASRTAEGRRTDTWALDLPHPVYLVTLVAGDLAAAELPSGRRPLPVLAPADFLPEALANFHATGDMLRFLETLTGRPYPYPKYAQVCVGDFTAGGMENISATTLTLETVHLPQDEPQVDSTDLVLHELAHMWFGDLLTCRNWSELWLNESFATWAEGLWRRHADADGDARYRAMVRRWRALAVAAEDAASRPLRWPDHGDPDEDLFTAHDYEGGAARLHMLRERLGHEAFGSALREYVRRHEADVVVTADLQAVLEEVSGQDLSRWFDEWIHGTGYPILQAEVERNVTDEPRLVVTQTQAEQGMRADFELPTTILWSRGGQEHRERVTLRGRVTRFPLSGRGELDWVCLDPDVTVPGVVSLRQGADAWRAQLASATDPLARLDAAEFFRSGGAVPDGRPAAAESLETLAAAARGDAFVDVRVTAVSALATVAAALASERQADTSWLLSVLVPLGADGDARVREAAVAALSWLCGEDGLAAVLDATDDANGSVVAAALAALAARAADADASVGTRAEQALWRAGRKVLADHRPRPRLRRAAVAALARLPDTRVPPLLVRVARSDPSPTVRAEALRRLPGHDDPHGALYRVLVEALWEASFIVRAAAADALGRLGGMEATLPLRARRDIENDPVVIGAIDEALAALDERRG